jgi:hypothetical protein
MAASPDGDASEDEHVEAEVDRAERVYLLHRFRLVLHVDDQLQDATAKHLCLPTRRRECGMAPTFLGVQ